MKPSFDSVAALMCELSVEEEMALVDSDNRPKIKKFLSDLSPSPALVGTSQEVRLAEEFSPHHFFKVSLEKNAPVKVSYVGDNFTNWFLGKIENKEDVGEAIPGDGLYRKPGRQNDAKETTFRFHTLTKNSVDGPIIAALGGETNAETTLVEIAGCMKQQANGEQGLLLTNGDANIFYVRDSALVLRAVRVDWGQGGWGVDASSVSDKHEWHPHGYRVFSPDSSL